MEWKRNCRKGNGGNHEWYRCGSPSWWLWEATRTHQGRIMCVNSSLHGPQILFILSFLIGTVITASSFTYTPAERYASQLLPWLLKGGTHLFNTPQINPVLHLLTRNGVWRNNRTKHTAWSSTPQQQAENLLAVPYVHHITKQTNIIRVSWKAPCEMFLAVKRGISALWDSKTSSPCPHSWVDVWWFISFFINTHHALSCCRHSAYPAYSLPVNTYLRCDLWAWIFIIHPQGRSLKYCMIAGQ